ncbi:HNH endonuclease [Brunnivagina elsteri]|uniref:HNH endonuclease n=1 Tax=Brunnivagina elsteri CCALA 953 TaxID=987040 RepID=A0A2A2TMQ1_9CYAN|nr:HNH endonuclease [Calothrix elsteri]PAX59791.1 HNH endonuclease [Calothrix elsteri CCALA 953]
MDLFKETSKLTDTAKNAIQGTTNYISGVVDEVKTNTQQSIEAIDQTINSVKSSILDVTFAGMTVANSLKELPQTAQELAVQMPKIAQRLKYRAGVRVGDAPRNDADIMKLFNKIPGTSKLGGQEKAIREFLRDKHGSHIHPRSQGGANAADNIVWEVGADNIRRGAKVMTVGEQFHIRVYNAIDSIIVNSGAIARLGITATGTAVLTQVVVTAISYSLDLYRGDITVDEYKDLIFETAKQAGIATPIVFLVLIAVLALFPEFAVILSAPVVVAGFNALFGISIAMPIISSLTRHLEAGGFGVEFADGYKSLTSEA